MPKLRRAVQALGLIVTLACAACTAFNGRGLPAVPAVLSYRLATYWLPVAPGWAAFRWLQRRELV